MGQFDANATKDQLAQMEREFARKRAAAALRRAAELARLSEEATVTDADGTVWTYIVVDESFSRVCGCETERESLAVPDELGGYPVREIDAEALSGLDSLREIVCAAGVERVGAYAFRRCANLRRLVLAAATTSYSSSWIARCPVVEELVLPGGLEVIEADALACATVQVLEIGAGTRAVRPGAFEKGRISSVRIDPDNAHLTTEGTCIYSADGTELVVMACKVGEYAVESGCRRLGEKAFAGAVELTRVSLPEGLVSIGLIVGSGCDCPLIICEFRVKHALHALVYGAHASCAIMNAMRESELEGADMDIFQFEQFQMIAECGTMREAAERLFLSQPTLSHNIKKLEGELGCKLFTRSSNQLRLTPYGELVLARTREIDATFKAMVAEVEDMKRREEATLRIGSYSYIASGFVMSPVAAEFPDSRFVIDNCPTDALKAGLKGGRYDVLLATDVARDKAFKWQKLYTERAYVSAPRDHALANRESVSAADMAELPYSIESGLLGYSDWFSYILRNAGVPDDAIERRPFKEHLRVKDAFPTCNLITSLIMGFVRTSEVRSIIPIDEPYAKRNIGLLYRAGAPEKVLTFVKHMKSHAAGAFSGNAFIPYFLFPEDVSNLHIQG